MTETSTSQTKRQKVWAFTKTTLRRPLVLGVIGMLVGGLLAALITWNVTARPQDTATRPIAPSPETRDENTWPPFEKGFTIHLGSGPEGTPGRSASDIITRDEIKKRYREVVAEERFEDWVQEELESLERQRCAEIDWTRNGVPYCAVEPRKVGIRPKEEAVR